MAARKAASASVPTRGGAAVVDHGDADPVVARALGERERGTNTPISSVRGSFHAVSESPSSSPPWARWSREEARGPRTATMRPRRRRPRAGARRPATSSATIAVPSSAPATVPMLKPAWKRDMIARPRRCSTQCALDVHRDVPGGGGDAEVNRPITSGATPTVTGGDSTRPAPPITAIPATGARVPKRATIGPEDGSAITASVAIANRTQAELRGTRSSRSLTWGSARPSSRTRNP